jgi:hypothetical protein
MIRENLTNERMAKNKIAINDFTLLSSTEIVGLYTECELTHIFLVEKSKGLCHHYFAVCNYEEFKETDIKLKIKKITNKLIRINQEYSLGIIQKRISLEECKDMFDQLCIGSFSLQGNKVLMPSNIQLLPKTHIPSYWDGENVMLQKVLKPNFFGDAYIIEFMSIDNPFSNRFSIQEFEKINQKINILII